MKSNHLYQSDVRYLNEKSLWSAFRQGDREAFSQLYKTYLDSLFNYGMKVVSDRSLVKDCLQELFIDLWKNRQNLADTDHIQFYLYKALRRKLIREAEKNRKFKLNSGREYMPEQIELPVEHQMIANEILNQKKSILSKALSKISLRQQEVLNLLFFENYSYEQISQLMGINVKSVYTLAWKAFASIRKSLRELK